ncbi:MAG: 2-oxoglutarate dehydrogenase complex dihydrolipoyllysine-residue succinyltransferase [Calditrichaeota bacterium]|nr:2-oxoglutarate dehydrogenase complex dihydrolipoyllysine-residue succinyltransferase [Calditrichota bacterium]
MKIEIKVPAAGESVTEADIASWSKADGDYVELDDIILELETDKASLEIAAEAAGKLSIKAKEGETVKVGQVIGVIDTEAAENGKAAAPESAKKEEKKTETKAKSGSGKVIEITVPAAGESVSEADIASWSKADGDYVEQDEVIVELETDKASLEMTAEVSGQLKILVQEGTVKVGQVIGKITESSETKSEQDKTAPVETKAESAPEKGDSYAKGVPSPAAAKIMAEKNIDQVEGSGKDGRVTKADALNATAKSAETKSETKVDQQKSSEPTSSGGSRNIRKEKMTRIRRTISNRLVEAQQTAALLTTFNEIDMHEVMEIRKKYKEKFKEKHQVGLGFMSFFTKAAANALLEFPILNAQVDDESIIYHDFCDIGIAVATPRGLVVPILRNVEGMNFHQVESQILNFAIKGRDGHLTPDDMTGGTFTITNGGTFGSMMSTPIINRPQSAILGMHNIVERPTVVNGEIKIRPIMYVAVTYDHRIIDGSDAVRFLVKIKELVEDPTRLMLNL